jgi:plastocyanin
VRKLAVAALLAAAVAIAAVACGQPAPTGPSMTIIKRASPPIPAPAPTKVSGEDEVTGPAIDGTKITINMIDNGGVGPMSYDPADFTFGVGEGVNFTFIAEAAFHTFTVNDLDINVEVNAGEAKGLDFVFEEPGTYALICVPHEALGMVGTITVQ